MRKAWLYSLAGIFVGIAVPFVVFSHGSGCHSWHSCPPDKGNYVCGDKGYCSQCPDNQYCVGGAPISSAPSSGGETLATPPLQPPPAAPSPETQATRVLPPPALLSSPPPTPSAPAQNPSPVTKPEINPVPSVTSATNQIQTGREAPAQEPHVLKSPQLPKESETANPPVKNPEPLTPQKEIATAAAVENSASLYLFFAASIVIGLIAAAGFLLFRL